MISQHRWSSHPECQLPEYFHRRAWLVLALSGAFAAPRLWRPPALVSVTRPAPPSRIRGSCFQSAGAEGRADETRSSPAYRLGSRTWLDRNPHLLQCPPVGRLLVARSRRGPVQRARPAVSVSLHLA